MAEKRRREREERVRRVIDLAERVMVAIGERDQAVMETEKRAGEALRELTEREGLSLSEAVEWCGETVSVREATRLRRLAGDQADSGDGEQGGDGAAGLAPAGSGGAGARGTGRRSPRCRAVSACGGPERWPVGPSESARTAAAMAGSGTRRGG